MDLQLSDIITWKDQFGNFFGEIKDAFGRKEVQNQAYQYLHGLLAPIEGKNCWNIAQATHQKHCQSLQRLLRNAHWDEKKVHQFLQERACQNFGEEDGIFTIDETGFVKSGSDSVGVQRQYTGTAGKIENCQIATFLGYVSDKGHVLLDRQLYMPQNWCNDEKRRKKAHVPEEIKFKTKPQQGFEMLKAAKEAGFPGSWVTADTVYGNSSLFRQGLFTVGLNFVLAVSRTTEVVMKKLSWRHNHRGKQQPQVETRKIPVSQIAHKLPLKKWKRLKVAPGSKGWREYQWVFVEVILPESPHQKVTLLVRRSLSDGQLAYYLCAAPPRTSLRKLAEVASSRWSIEQCFKESKGETGLDQYQVRTWEGWHRHTLLSMLAHLFLAELRLWYQEQGLDENEILSLSVVRKIFEIALPTGELSDIEKWRWLQWKRRHNLKAKLSHYRRREMSQSAA